MNSKIKLMETVLEIIDKRGRHIVEHAIDQIIRSQYEAGLVSSALRYYAKVTLPRVLPIFPTLTSISCEMTDGDPADVVPFATAMVLITSSGDLHDDIIDRSIRKYSRKTVLGRFGTSVTLLAGDALLVQGQALLQIACETLKKEQRRAILRLIPKAFCEIIKAEAKEMQLWQKDEISPSKYLEMTRMKGAVAEMQCEIGGIIAGANVEEIRLLEKYGRTMGMLSTIKDEFADVLDYHELKSRLRNECPPLPILCALQDPDLSTQIKPMLDNPSITTADADELTKAVFSSWKVHGLAKRIKGIALRQIKTNALLKKNESGREAELLLEIVSNVLENS